ncbi:hypothetical protein ARMGADRAFT_1089631 [Armillaria gallica]|uniref:Uncharacterized protein n=1 Tax=Armillaria gallica TaxID=47427 RepID=A0A2H3CMH5_ARMGA|nr:hypothetical protein ARMGADRAFT_1089631 [Armillaria gallica]
MVVERRLRLPHVSVAEMKYTCYVHLNIYVLFLSLSRRIPRAGDVPGISFLGLDIIDNNWWRQFRVCAIR